MKLNLGCGSEKIPGYINIDVEKKCKPDLVHDFIKKPLPYKSGSVSEVLLFHTIEHIQRRYHRIILAQIWIILKPKGFFLISFPEFKKCFENWNKNKAGQKQFWEATMFGRQAYPSDHHVVPMDSTDFTQTLLEMGFENITVVPEEEPNEFNTVISCTKGTPYKSYEQLVHEDLLKTSINITGKWKGNKR